MNSNDIKKYFENAINTSGENSKSPSVALFKLFLTSFILLLIYLLYNSFFGKNSTIVKGNGLNVIGFYYGSVDKNSDKAILINLGQENKIGSGIKETNVGDQSAKETETKSETVSKPSKVELSKSIKIGDDFSKVSELLGNPDKKLDVTLNQKQSGFALYVWDTKPRLMMTFYKNKLINKLTQ